MRIILLASLLLLSTAGAATPTGDALVPRLEQIAAQGNAEALYHLGMSYQTGSSVPIDHRRALDYFRRAAAKGDPLAAYKIGCFHAGQNDILPRDAAQALSYKLIAAEAGYALAQQDVAELYLERGEAAAAERWMARAAAQGVPDALLGYASLHNGHNGLPRDDAIVVGYFTLFLARIDASEEQRAWLDRERGTLTAAERDRHARIVADYRASPSALTLRALSGQRAAKALVDSAGQ